MTKLSQMDLFVVAQNPNTAQATLVDLSKHETYFVRWYVARNPNTPPEILNLLVMDTSYLVRREAGGNPHTPCGIWLLDEPYRTLP